MRRPLRGGAGKKLIALAPWLSKYPGELEADFQQFYGLSLEGLLDGGEFGRAQALAAQLPRDSRTMRALEPSLAWGDAEHLLAYIADTLSFFRYENRTANGARRTRKPKPYPRPKPPKRRARPDERTVHGMSAQAVGEILSKPRR